MNFLDKLFGRTALKNRIESLQKTIRSSDQAKEEERKKIEYMYTELETKYRESENRIKHLETELNKREATPEEPMKIIETPKMCNKIKDVFGWVLLTNEYKKMFDSVKYKDLGSNCLVCIRKTNNDYITLQNGRYVHKSCYDDYLKQVCSIKEADAKDYFQKNMETVCMLKIIHTLWPVYPPDWKQRCEIILKRANYACENEECGESEDELQIHHIEETGVGGNNNLSNLICLCKECHGIIHKRQIPHHGSWYERKAKIEEAIVKNTNISFNYINRNKERSTRIIEPLQFKFFDDACQYLGVIGHCFLKNETSTFNIRRMSQVEILHDKSVKECFYHDVIQKLLIAE